MKVPWHQLQYPEKDHNQPEQDLQLLLSQLQLTLPEQLPPQISSTQQLIA
jgi:hypothetical protein